MNSRYSIRFFALLGAFAFTSAAGAGETGATWVATGLNERVWRNVVMEVDAQGQGVTVTNSYTELAAGLCWWNEETGAFEETQEAFVIAPDGTAVARRGQHKVFIKANLNEKGAVDMFLPDGQRFRSNPMALSYFDLRSGKSVILGEIKDCQGEQIAPNVIWFPDAFDTVKAGIRFTYTRNGFEQDIIIWQDVGTPEEYGLDSRTTTLDCYTELYDVKEPEIPGRRASLADEDGDPVLDFGSLRIGEGTAYFLHERLDEVPVQKSYEVIDGARRFLIEHVPYLEIAPVLERLQARAEKPDSATIARRSFSGRRELAAAVPPLGRGVELAGIQPTTTTLPKALVLDYFATLTSTMTDYTLTSGGTFYVSGAVSASGSLTVESGAVVKYAAGASINCGSAALNITAESWCPAHFTAKDDNTVGAHIDGSTGTPSGYYANPALKIAAGNRQVTNVRIAHALLGVSFDSYSAGGNNGISHSQFVSCHTPLQFNGYYGGGVVWQNVYVRNVLITDAYSAFKGYSFNATVEHLTATGCDYLVHDYNGQTYGTTSSVSLKNTLLSSIGADYLSRYVSINRNTPYTQTVSSAAFAQVGAGGHYLATDTYRDVGTTSIDPTLLADIAVRTTFAPEVLSGAIKTTTVLAPRARRDKGIADLGFHYMPLDYVASGLEVNGAALILTNGVSVGLYGTTGIWLKTAGALLSRGTAAARNHLVRYNCVQEAPVAWGDSDITSNVAIKTENATTPLPMLELRFTDLEMAGREGLHLFTDAANSQVQNVTLSDSTIRGGSLQLGGATGTDCTCINNVWSCDQIGFSGSATLALHNNLFRNGTVVLNRSGPAIWTVADNHFQKAVVNDLAGGIAHDYNAYVSCTGRLVPTAAHDVVLTTFNFAAGPLGQYYHQSTNLRDRGSQTDAALRGLYHHTTTSNQDKEGNTPLDVGFHYVAVELGPTPSEGGLVGRWQFDEGTGTTAYDSSGLGHTGSLQPGAAWSNGQTGSAITVGDANGYVSALESAALRLPGDITVACRMRKSAEASDWSRLVGKGGGSSRNYGLWEEPGGNRILLQQVTSGGTYCNLFSTTATQVGRWYHVAAVRSGTTSRLYINGIQESTGTFSGTMVTSPDPLTIGYALYYASFKGSIDDVRVYNRALSATEIAVVASMVCDVDADGISDYDEDIDGDGHFDSATESDWLTGSQGVTGPTGLQVFTPLK